MIIESLRVRNYKALRDVHMTKMPRLAVFVGANGSGKSTLLDVFAFLKDCVQRDVSTALQKRDGMHEVFSRDASGDLTIELTLRLSAKARRLAYRFDLMDIGGDFVVAAETLTAMPHRGRKREVLLSFHNLEGFIALDNGNVGVDQPYKKDYQGFSRSDTLALSALGQLKKNETVSSLRATIDDWACTPFQRMDRRLTVLPTMSSTRMTESAVLTQEARRLHRDHREEYDEAIRKMSRRVPGLKGVEPYEAEDGRLILRFQDGSFHDPFPLSTVSEGTRRLLQLYLMLNTPEAAPLLTYEEPENDLYPDVVWPLAEEFRGYTDRGSQVFVSTHSPDFVNALNLEEVYWMEKRDGYATIVRAADDPNVRSQNEGGGLMGSLWTEGFFGKAHPR